MLDKKLHDNNLKISTAIGTMQHAGISVSPPDINKSSFTFIPDVENDTIIYGIKGINKIGNEIVKEIIDNRPYSSVEDFLTKVKVNKPQMVNLIKSGAFDKFGSSREEVMYNYIDSITEKRQRLTLQNMKMLIDNKLIPEELNYEVKVYNFNRYLKKLKKGLCYILDDRAYAFYEKKYDLDLVKYEDGNFVILQKDWDKIYKKEMDSVRNYIKNNTKELLNKLNNNSLKENMNKYCSGTISKWEMDSISFYYHEHELEYIDEELYDIWNFFDLKEEPVVDYKFEKDGKEILMFKLYRIAGTVLDKNKNKGSLSVLTKYGVVNVKIFGPVFAKYDKQISQKLPDGKKKIIEKSLFSRGNKLLITGLRRGDNFILKTYKNTQFHPLLLITEVNEDGTIETYHRED